MSMTLLAAAVLAASAGLPPWRTPEVNEINRLPPRCLLVPCQTEDVAVNIAKGIVQEPNLGVQLAIANISGDLKGAQIGIFNEAANIQGLQIGVVNFAETMIGCQIGLANIITNGALPFMVVFNCNF